ncbi:MAG: ATP-binding protein [Euryarchaeota archaeon]|nr:ATP-binding protein [Euryarchaeota archaeon]MDE2046585.1 ATP-binding protein [Thermoplasmata archaeon]
MSLFDLAPKETPSALFGRERELQELTRLIEARRWVAVLGPRMMGKTSLVRAAQRRLDRPGAYVNLWGVRSLQGVLEGLVRGFTQSRSLLSRLRSGLRRIDGISVGPAGVSVSTAARPAAAVWDVLDLVGSEKKDCLIVLDEVQELGSNSGALLRLLGNVFNSHPNVCFVFTGPMFGVIRSLLHPAITSPLYGRSPVPVELGPFDRTTAEAFLRKGTEEAGTSLTREEVATALDGPLDGTPGWLTLLGNHLTVRHLDFDRAFQTTLEEGKQVAKDEIGHFLLARDPRLYWPALKVVAQGAGWAEVRDAIGARQEARINNATVQRVLGSLVADQLVVKEGSTYRVRDPMVRAYVAGASRPPR